MSDLVDPQTGLCSGCQAGSLEQHHLCDLACACATACECPNSIRFGVLRGEPLPDPPDEDPQDGPPASEEPT